MPNLDYYRRQAASHLNLARSATDPEIKLHLIQLANDYRTRAHKAAHEQLDASIANSHVGVTCLTRPD
jgi:hypothetical protein